MDTFLMQEIDNKHPNLLRIPCNQYGKYIRIRTWLLLTQHKNMECPLVYDHTKKSWIRYCILLQCIYMNIDWDDRIYSHQKYQNSIMYSQSHCFGPEIAPLGYDFCRPESDVFKQQCLLSGQYVKNKHLAVDWHSLWHSPTELRRPDVCARFIDVR